MPRIVIELDPSEHKTLRGLCAELDVPYARLFRIFLKFCVDGTIKRKVLEAEIAKNERPILDVKYPDSDRARTTLQQQTDWAKRENMRTGKDTYVIDAPKFVDEMFPKKVK